MLGRTYAGQDCSAARALEIVGERWSLLILRDAIFGHLTRFTELQRSLGVAPNILTSRLERFVEAGLMTQDGREYHLTTMGRELAPAIVALTQWGDRWVETPDGPPIRYAHDGCGGTLEHTLVCDSCGKAAPPDDIAVEPLREPRVA
ncbi:winged helix-turn-helix transcriptional regulator [Promicromonospora iranensis]|uniref:DNA-binding HxlR family transcriptional regulator n=1 Tax=Promicromonospora iranensis TaxID=1105144 RepID=A0ABU2CT52_9MICO|nr:helix-turn-helix domain-containing protein [Promicromonospora iranensis]MDR7384495.1 DNA-binding HxlR family transcriptional regulator [Promicromonospora iranensis]